jgi:DNA-binding transcriptional regulator PaaX
MQAHRHNPEAGKSTLIGMIRDVFESATGPICSKDLPRIAEETGFHPTTVRLQFYRWRAESKTAQAARCRKQ